MFVCVIIGLLHSQPRLKCLLHLVDHLTPESSEFIAAITPEVSGSGRGMLAVQSIDEPGNHVSMITGDTTSNDIVMWPHFIGWERGGVVFTSLLGV